MKIEIIHGKKEYQTGRKQSVSALNDINISIEQADYVSLCGVSGSGKTTLLNIIGCLDKLTDGECLLDNRDTGKMSDKELSKIRNGKIGFVLQDYGLVRGRTVKENVVIPLYFSDVKLSEFGAHAEKALKKLGIEDLKNRKVQDLSGGQKQRVAIARAIINDPEVILADEPTGALDSETKKEIIKLFSDLNSEGRTLIVVTHDPEIAEAAKRQLFIRDGVLYEKD